MYLIPIMLIVSIVTYLTMEASIYNNTLKEIPLKSASELDYPPFSVVTPEGKADGFSVELLQNTVHAMGGEVTFYVDKWSKIKQELEEGKIDVLPVVGRTDEREKYFDFTAPYLVMHGAVFTRVNDERIQTYEDLKNKQLAVMKGDNAEEYLRVKKITKEIIAVESYEKALQLLSSGQYDAVIAQQLVGIGLINKLQLKNIKVSDFILDDFKQDFSFAVTEGNKELLALLNEGLSITIANGTYDKIYQKWFRNYTVSSEMDPKIFMLLLTLFMLLLLTLIVVFIWNKTLQKTVLKKTHELAQLNDSLKTRIEEAVETIKTKDEIMIAQSNHAAMGEMISMIAHQWRQPLSVIGMNANNLLIDIDLEMYDPVSFKLELEKIELQVQHLSKTIDDFRDFFQPNKSQEKLCVGDVITKSLAIIEKSIVNNDIKLQLDLKSKSIINIHSNELLQVLLNLINNSKDVIKERKVIDGTITIKSFEKEDAIHIEVCDNGGGIESESKNKIFTPYFSTKGKNGTGIGLYMSKTVVEKHLHGTISFENRGSNELCFIIILPKNESN